MSELSSHISPYLRTFQRKAFWIFSLTCLTTWGAIGLSLKDPHTYVSSFRILLEPIDFSAKLNHSSTSILAKELPGGNSADLDYPTQLEVLKSPLILSRIARQVKIYLPETDISTIEQDLRTNLIVERITIGASRYDWTKIFEVTYKATDPKLVGAVAKATAEQYLEYSLEERQDNINSGVKFIEEQLPELEEKVASLQNRQQQLQEQYHLIDPEQRGEELFARVDEIERQKLDNASELLELRTLVHTLQEQLNLTPEQGVVTLALNQNPNHRELLRQLQQAEREFAEKSAWFTPDSPQVLALEEDKQNLLKLIERKIQPTLKQYSISLGDNSPVLNFQNEAFLELTQQLVDTHNQIKVLQARDRSLDASKETLKKPARQLPAIARQYSEIERQLNLTQDVLGQLLTQRETLRVKAAQEEAPWKLLGQGDILKNANGEPMAFPPNRMRKIMAGLMGGIFLGMGIAIFWEKSRNIFYAAEDIQDVFLLPLLGEIPPDDRTKILSGERNEEPDLLEDYYNSKFLQAFKSFYAELSFLYADNPINSLIVSSVQPKDGQSTVALQLAKTVAAAGKQVLLVDASGHQSIQDPNPKSNFSGLRKQEHGNSALAEKVVRQVPGVRNLYLLPTNAFPVHNPTKGWSREIQDMMEDFQGEYDLIIYDSPHFLDSPDVSFLAAQTDGIVLVVRVGSTPQSEVREAMERINAFRLPILGVVANHFN